MKGGRVVGKEACQEPVRLSNEFLAMVLYLVFPECFRILPSHVLDQSCFAPMLFTGIMGAFLDLPQSHNHKPVAQTMKWQRDSSGLA